MSGSHEAGDRSQDAGTAPAPAPSAPPSFGKPEPPATGDEPTGDEETGGIGPVPVEIRLPIGLQKPWWADDDEPVPAPTPAAAEPAPAPPPAPEAERERKQAPETEQESLGTLVAGTGVPNVDTRRAVPREPIVERPRPASRDTDPDGIPVVDPDDLRPAEDEPVQDEPVQGKPVHDEPELGEPERDGPVLDEPEPGEPEPGEPQPDDDVEPLEAEREREPEDTPEPDAPEEVLSPDSFLPPGTTPPEDSTETPIAPIPIAAVPVATAAAKAQFTADDTEASKQTRPQVIVPVYHAEGGLSIDSPQPPRNDGTPFGVGPLSTGGGTGGGTGTGRGSRGRRKPLLIGGGVAAAVLLIGIGGVVVATGDSGSTTRPAGAAETSRAQPSPTTPSQPPSSAPARPEGPSVIDSARTDPQPLALTEAFPVPRITLSGRAFIRDRSSVNHQCALVARGAMARALSAQRCSSVVRVTFLDRGRSLAVTSGVAVLPTKAAALSANKAGDPSKYEWFRGMPGKRTPDIDRAGGYAASTVRGRYIVYAYATYANGKQPAPADQTLKTVAEQFVDYALRPIDTRARG